MNEFRIRLMEKLKHHLESEECRYTDNSYVYFMRRMEEALERDAYWLAHARIPSLRGFTRMYKDRLEFQIENKSPLYEMLRDEYSRETLVTVAAYSLLGHRLIKFPYYTPDTIPRTDRLHERALRENPDSAMARQVADNWFRLSNRLYYYDASCCGLNATMYSTPQFLYGMVYDNDYRYDEGGVVIDVEPGDYVMDGGGCFGDTALFFAHKAGPGGKIFSFEPNPFLYLLFAYNIGLNPEFRDRMILADTAMSDAPGEDCPMDIAGWGSRLHTAKDSESDGLHLVKTTTIDEEARKHRLERLDFIKMDIEGSELAALKGAAESITRFKPKLAICVYHKPEDYIVIPEFINALGLGYRFYLKHHFMNGWETVLYARVE